MAFDPFKPKKDPFWDQEVAIKFRPRKAFKLLAVLLILLVVFFLGRWSVSESSSVEKTPSTESSSNTTSKILGFITSLFTSDDEETSKEETPQANKTKPMVSVNRTTTTQTSPSNQTVQNQTVANQTPSTSSPTANETADEEVITSYKKVSFAVADVGKEWHTTWGKIIYFTYTIKNEEAGTIKPSYFLMKVEGYPDIDKKVPLSEASQTIRSKTSISSTAFVPQGFAYNEVTAGSLENLKITFVLFDSSDKTMASYDKEFNVKG